MPRLCSLFFDLAMFIALGILVCPLYICLFLTCPCLKCFWTLPVWIKVFNTLHFKSPMYFTKTWKWPQRLKRELYLSHRGMAQVHAHTSGVPLEGDFLPRGGLLSTPTLPPLLTRTLSWISLGLSVLILVLLYLTAWPWMSLCLLAPPQMPLCLLAPCQMLLLPHFCWICCAPILLCCQWGPV